MYHSRANIYIPSKRACWAVCVCVLYFSRRGDISNLSWRHKVVCRPIPKESECKRDRERKRKIVSAARIYTCVGTTCVRLSLSLSLYMCEKSIREALGNGGKSVG